MQQESFNEAERYVLQHWGASRELELCMETVRERYAAIAERAARAFCETNPEIDVSTVYVTQRWGKGELGVGRKAWQSEGDYPTGYYIENIRLEVLADESEPPPKAYLWIKPSLKNLSDQQAAIKAIHEAAKPLFKNLDLPEFSLLNDGKSVLGYRLPEGRRAILDMLCRGDSQEFVDLVSKHLDILHRMTPTLNSILVKG